MATNTTLCYECPGCEKVIDVEFQLIDEDITCPNCKQPFRAEPPKATPIEECERSAKDDGEVSTITSPEDPEKSLMKLHPAMARNHPFVFVLLTGVLMLGLAGIGAYLAGLIGIDFGDRLPGSPEFWQGTTLLIGGTILIVCSGIYFLVWKIKTWFVTLSVSTERSVLQRGLISRETSEVRHDDVRNLQVDQSILQRILGVGTIAISSSGQDDFEIRVRGLPNPSEIASKIRKYQ